MQGSGDLNVMIKAAQSPVKDFAEVENLQVSVRRPGDFVSRADCAAEEIILKALIKARPNYGRLGESTGVTEGIAEFECALIADRIEDGRRLARQRGVVLGRPLTQAPSRSRRAGASAPR